MNSLQTQVAKLDHRIEELTNKRKRLSVELQELKLKTQEKQKQKIEEGRQKLFQKGQEKIAQKVVPAVKHYHLEESPRLPAEEYTKLFKKYIFKYHESCKHEKSQVFVEQILGSAPNELKRNTDDEDVTAQLTQIDRNIVDIYFQEGGEFQTKMSESEIKQTEFIYCFQCKQLLPVFFS